LILQKKSYFSFPCHQEIREMWLIFALKKFDGRVHSQQHLYKKNPKKPFKTKKQ